jgi:uncharacterized protein (AIM24 family)
MLTAEKQVFVTVSKDGPYIVSGNAQLAEQVIVANANGESLYWQEGEVYAARENVRYADAVTHIMHRSVTARIHQD